MKGRQALIDRIGNRPAAIRLVDGQPDDLLVDPPDGIPRPGAIYRAKAGRPAKGQGGVFVGLPHGHGFLRDARGVSAGAAVLVQVGGYAEPGKAVPVSARILVKSRYAIATPGQPGVNISRAITDAAARKSVQTAADAVEVPQGTGVIVRTSATGADPQAITDDIARVCVTAGQVMAQADGPPALVLDGPGVADLVWRDWTDLADHEVDATPGCFAATGVDAAIAALAQPAVDLPHGGSIWVEPTRALVAVDVNTGSDVSQSAGLRANLDAARALPRALRLRGLGGQIAVDFAPMPKGQRGQVDTALKAAFRACPVETTLVGWTPLGHFEMTRKRERLPLTEALR